MTARLMTTPIPFIMMGIYIVIVLCLSCKSVIAGRLIRKGKAQTFEDFFTGNKSMSAVVVGLVTIVTFYSGTTFTGRVGFFYHYGVIALTTVFSCAASGIVMFFLAEKIWPMAKKYHCSTLSDILELRYQSRYVKLLAAFIIISFNIIWLITEIRTLGIIVHIASGGIIAQATGAGLAFSIVILYVCTGGVRSVAMVDSFSALVMLCGSAICVIFLIVWYYDGSIQQMTWRAIAKDPQLWVVGDNEFGFPYWISSITVSTLVMLIYPSNYMSICMGNSVRAVKKAALAVSCSGPWLMVYGIIAMAALGLGGGAIQNPESALLEMISYSGCGLMLGIVTTFIFAASLGTLDSTLISLSGILSNDIVINMNHIATHKACIGQQEENPAQPKKMKSSTGAEVKLTRCFILLLGISAWFLSLRDLPLLVLLANYASNGILQILPATIGGLYWKKATPAGAMTSMVAGVSAFLLLNFIKENFYQNSEHFMGGYFLGLPALLVGLIVFIAVSLLTWRKFYAAEENRRCIVSQLFME